MNYRYDILSTLLRMSTSQYHRTGTCRFEQRPTMSPTASTMRDIPVVCGSGTIGTKQARYILERERRRSNSVAAATAGSP